MEVIWLVYNLRLYRTELLAWKHGQVVNLYFFSIDLEFLLKKGPICDEDIENIIRDIAGDPEDKKELLKILGIDGAIDEVNGLDSVDGAKPSVCNLVREDITYPGLLAFVLSSKSFGQTNVVFKHLLDKRGKLN